MNSLFAELAIMASQEEGGKLEKLQVGTGEPDHSEWSDVCFVEVINVGWCFSSLVLMVMVDFSRRLMLIGL